MPSVCKCNVYMKYKWNSCSDTGSYLPYFEDIIKLANSNNIPNVKHFLSQGLWLRPLQPGMKGTDMDGL